MDPKVRHDIAKDINKVEKTVKKTERIIDNGLLIIFIVGFVIVVILFAVLGRFF